ncbi:hypothetical protein D918_09179 [Trichuris suis]|nr:hypothetical protein D918_09179 [Trichuris suis]
MVVGDVHICGCYSNRCNGGTEKSESAKSELRSRLNESVFKFVPANTECAL